MVKSKPIYTVAAQSCISEESRDTIEIDGQHIVPIHRARCPVHFRGLALPPRNTCSSSPHRMDCTIVSLGCWTKAFTNAKHAWGTHSAPPLQNTTTQFLNCFCIAWEMQR